MIKFKVMLMALGLVVSMACVAKDAVALKPVPIIGFMMGDLVKPIPISVLVPEGYEPVEFDEEPGKYYWMRPKDVKKVINKQELPASKGYMYGSITLNVGYDAENDVFTGLEEPEVQAQYKHYFSHYTLERIEANGYPVVLLKLQEKGSTKTSYMLYVGLKISTNALLIVYIPPKDSKQKGDFVWAAQKDHFDPPEPESSDQ